MYRQKAWLGLGPRQPTRCGIVNDGWMLSWARHGCGVCKYPERQDVIGWEHDEGLTDQGVAKLA